MATPVEFDPSLRRKGLAGKLCISRPNCYGGEEYVEITLQDATSHSMMVEIKVPLAEFARALTGFSNQPCRFDVGAVEAAGSVYQYKTEIVRGRGDLFRSGPERDRIEDEALAPFEIDGWRARRSDIGNGHRAVRGESTEAGAWAYSVTFFRNVRPDDGETVESLQAENEARNRPAPTEVTTTAKPKRRKIR